MSRERTLDALGRARVVAILRGDLREIGEDAAAALLAGGLRALEVSLVSPGALGLIARLRARFASQLLVGAGTVRTPEDVRGASGAGAQFLISPHVSAAVIEETRRLGLVSLPGALTPTEIVTALAVGADAVKLFPAEWVGPAGMASLLAPLPEVRLVPTGGVTAELAREYLAHGAWAVGVGSPLLGGELGTPGALERLRERARVFSELARRPPPFDPGGGRPA